MDKNKNMSLFIDFLNGTLDNFKDDSLVEYLYIYFDSIISGKSEIIQDTILNEFKKYLINKILKNIEIGFVIKEESVYKEFNLPEGHEYQLIEIDEKDDIQILDCMYFKQLSDKNKVYQVCLDNYSITTLLKFLKIMCGDKYGCDKFRNKKS